MQISLKDTVLILLLTFILYVILGTYAYHVHEEIYSSEVAVGGNVYDMIKLRGFVEPHIGYDFILTSGGYEYQVKNPLELSFEKTIFGDTAVFLYDDGVDYVAVFIEQQNFIYVKYIISFIAGLSVIFLIFVDYVNKEDEDV